MKCIHPWGRSRQSANTRERIYQRGGSNRKKPPISLARVTITESDYDESGTEQSIERTKTGREED